VTGHEQAAAKTLLPTPIRITLSGRFLLAEFMVGARDLNVESTIRRFTRAANYPLNRRDRMGNEAWRWK
jgi:hypothetical protein